MIRVEVVFCPGPGQLDRTALDLPDGSTVQVALDASGVLERHPVLTTAPIVGVWGRAKAMTQVLRERDRIELYRPLQCDPKEARRLRYRQKKSGNSPAPTA